MTKNRFAQERWSTEFIKRDQLFLAMLKVPKSSERLDVTEIPTCVGEDDLPDGFETGGDGGADTGPEDATAVADEATVAKLPLAPRERSSLDVHVSAFRFQIRD